MSWWDLGQSRGYPAGNDGLNLYDVICGFCHERSRFSKKEIAVKKNSDGSRKLHYDLLTCEQCGNLTFVFWGGEGRIYDFIQAPYPIKTTSFPDHWPSDVGRYWLQAKQTFEAKAYDATALMTRSAIQLAIRSNGASGANLQQEIKSLGDKGFLPPIFIEWSHEVRILGNDNAHPSSDTLPTTAADAKAAIDFLNMLLKVLYDLPKQIADFRSRRK